MCFVLVQILKQVPRRPPISWYRAVQLAPIPDIYNDLETVMTPNIGSLYCNHPLKRPDGEATKVTSITTHWNGIPEDGTFIGSQTPLNRMDPQGVPGILELMKQRGWKDHFMVHYEENMEAPADSDADVDSSDTPSSDSEAEQEESQPPTSKLDYHPAWSFLADVPVGPPAADHEILVSLLERESKSRIMIV